MTMKSNGIDWSEYHRLLEKVRSDWYWVIVLLVVGGGIAYWYFDHPSDEALRRQQICKDWGYSDEVSLARCRESQQQLEAVIAPKFHQAAAKAVTEFNNELARIAINKTVAGSFDYRPASIADIEKSVEGMVPTNANFPLEGQRFKLIGRIITNTPDWGDEDSDNGTDKPAWQPRTFELWGPFVKAKNAIPASIDLDIESLNRDERQLIQSHCEIVSFTECRVVVLGHIGRISERGDAYIEYRGIVVDQVDIRPIDPKTYRMTLGPWQDSKLAKPPPWEVPQ